MKNATSFKPGTSGNPDGRPKGYKGVARLIMKETRDGAELVEYALKIFRDEKADPKERHAMHQWLSDRGLGKAPQEITVTPGSNENAIDWSKVPEEDRERLLEAIAYVEALAGGPVEH